MKQIRRLFSLAAVSVGLASTIHAQELSGRDKWSDSARVLIESGVRKSSIETVDSARILIERALTAFPNDPLLLHYQGYALYRKATLTYGRNTKQDMGPTLKSAEDVLKRSTAKLRLPESYALQSAVYGQLIAGSRNPLTGISLGPKSSDAMTRAVAEGPKNPRVWLMRGIGAMFTPSMWGGGLDKAEEFLKQSIVLFETDHPAPPLPAWGRAESYIWLGQVYAKQGKANAARAAYENAVKADAENTWARALLTAPIQSK